MPTASTVLKDFFGLPAIEQNVVLEKLIHTPIGNGDMSSFIENVRFSDGRVCPICGKDHIIRNGRRKDGKQKFICRNCGKSFVLTTNSITSGTKKALSIWEKFIDCMMNGFSIRKTAQECTIHRNTAFAWRHKVLDALQEMAAGVVLDGIIEADETFLDVSYKGNHKRDGFNMPREAHHRGGMSKKRGLSKDKVCIPCAVNRNGLSVAQASNLARVKTDGLKAVFNGRVESGSTFITDKASAYMQFADDFGLELIRLKSETDSRKGLYNLQRINNYHSKLKEFIRRFNGVSTKYLNNYLIWHNFVNYAKEEYREKRRILLSFVLTAYKTVRYCDLPSRSPLPLLA